jgi:hypothetical protein
LRSIADERGSTWYVAFAVLGTSTGLVVGGHVVDALSARNGWSQLDAYRAVFWVYTAVGLVQALFTLLLSQDCEHQQPSKPPHQDAETEPLLPTADDDTHPAASGDDASRAVETSKKEKKKPWTWNLFSSISPKSRAILFKLCSLFFLDSLGSGMVPFSLINYYLDRKFHLPKGKLGGIMSATWYAPPFPQTALSLHTTKQPAGSSPPSATSSPPPSPAASA